MISLIESSALSTRDRFLITASALIAANHCDRLPLYIIAARQQGINEYEIMELIMQVAILFDLENCAEAVEISKGIFGNRDHRHI